MEESQISLKQLVILLFCGLLSPLIRMVPGETCQYSGAGGWLAPLLALPPFLLILWVMTATFRRLPRGSGLGELYRLAFGKKLGTGLLFLTALWLLVITAVNLRAYAEGFVSSIYQDTALWLFLLTMMALVWWVSCRGIATVCRMSQIFFYVLCITVGLLLLLGVREVEIFHIWPVWMEGWGNLLRSSLPVLAVLGYSIPILFHRSEISGSQGGLGMAAAWFAVLCLAMTALGAVITGVFGWQTVVRLQLPFFSLAKEVTMISIVERIESIVAAVWVFSDVALLSALLLSSGELMKQVTGKLSRRWILGLSAAAAVAGAVWISPNAFELRSMWIEVLQPWDGVVCLGIPLIACVLVWIRQRGTIFGRKRQR